MRKKKQTKQPTSEMLKSLSIGTSTTIDCRNPTHCESVRSLCYRIPKVYSSHRNTKYSCSIDYINSRVTIKVTSAK